MILTSIIKVYKGRFIQSINKSLSMIAWPYIFWRQHKWDTWLDDQTEEVCYSSLNSLYSLCFQKQTVGYICTEQAKDPCLLLKHFHLFGEISFHQN